MSDSEFISNDDDTEVLTNDFIERIPDDSDLSDGEDNDSYSYNMSSSTLMLNVKLSFLTWKAAFQHIKQWAHQ
ncbi:hypothetical protein RclHR1_10970005 [Rhizophagus clarus]|uniref:Uncharacterized protein n=1 Tax=Rhizophagus clarus TaxID=94130 RepID=A0A2Z6QHS1_9GLOM|nr:hypothetical protein RclHR1_10970005 [Rhizophagus clarus]GES90879.1 hypothetical protein RCL_jg14449.t1 [Rhizophagus clarus]